MVITINPIELDGMMFTAIRVELPKTNLLSISNEIGYVMCAALDVDGFDENEKLRERGVIAGRASGVRSIDDLLTSPLQKVTSTAKREYDWQEGMIVRDALLKIS